MMSLVFYYAPMSTATITEAVLAELGISYHGVELDIDAGDTRSPEFLKINPNGRVPVIIHDKVVIWESIAITIYLGEVFGVNAGLYPKLGPQRGEAMKWIAWSNTSLAEAAGRLSSTLPADTQGAVQSASIDFSLSKQKNQIEEDRARSDINKNLTLINDILMNKEYLLDEYTLVDTHLFVIVIWVSLMNISLSEFDNVSNWVERCSERPALKKLFAL